MPSQGLEMGVGEERDKTRSSAVPWAGWKATRVRGPSGSMGGGGGGHLILISRLSVLDDTEDE